MLINIGPLLQISKINVKKNTFRERLLFRPIFILTDIIVFSWDEQIMKNKPVHSELCKDLIKKKS